MECSSTLPTPVLEMSMDNAFDFDTTDVVAICKELERTNDDVIRLKAELEQRRLHGAMVFSCLNRHLGTTSETGEEVLRRLEGNVKRAMTQVVRDLKGKNWTAEDAREEATKRGLRVAHDYGLSGLSGAVNRHLDKKVREIFGTSHGPRRAG